MDVIETLMIKAAALLLFAAVLLLVNTKAGQQPLKALSFYGLIVCLVGAAWFVGRVVFS